MPEIFLTLPPEERSEILANFAFESGTTAGILEKDVWICWCLETIFKMPNRKTMAFKGGTSLSKAYNAISRFSEDVDVTIDHRGLRPSINPFDTSLSTNQRKRDAEELKKALCEYVIGFVAPYFQTEVSKQFPDQNITVEVVKVGEELHVLYPSALSSPNPYVKERVKIEFGGRNITDPKEQHEIVPTLAQFAPDLHFPSSWVDVLSGERTFWEKATLAHVECNKPSVRDAERLSRHWYDLFILADHEIGRAAVRNSALLQDVIKYKKVFYGSATANYDDCAAGGLKLLPNAEGIASLRADYQAMVGAGMIYGLTPGFDEIMERLAILETEINSHPS